jgi:hypothetical protein
MQKYNQEHYTQQQAWMKEHPENMYAFRRRFELNHPNYFMNVRKKFKVRIDMYNQAYNAKNKDKRSAENITQKMVLEGKCDICDSKESLLHHHPDYSEPTFYVTLCPSCHMYVHNGEAKK